MSPCNALQRISTVLPHVGWRTVKPVFGNACVAGYTESPNFPTLIPFQVGFGGVRDAFVSTLAESTELDFLFANGFEDLP